MKIYVKENGVTVVGKTWQVRAALKSYMRQFNTVQEWVDAVASHSK